jgi:ABC-type microcin C transport system permease subunit YejB
MHRINYILVRLLQMIPVALGITIILFFLLRAIPGDPAEIRLGIRATPEGVANLRQQMGLDKPNLDAVLDLLGDIGQAGFEVIYVHRTGERPDRAAPVPVPLSGWLCHIDVDPDHRANGYDCCMKERPMGG